MSQKRKNKEIKRKRRADKKTKPNKDSKKKNPSLELELMEWKRNILEKLDFKDGYDIEAIVETLCHRVGLQDIVIKSPKYIENSGVEKEIADLFVVCNETLLVFQVKHRVLDSSKDDEVIIGRAERTIQKLENQFSTFVHLYESDRIPKQKTNKEVMVEVSKKVFGNVVLVGIVAYPGLLDQGKKKKFELVNGFKMFKGYPSHLFDIDEFDKISLELDTPKDLKMYLNARAMFFGESNIGMTSELNLLAYYKMNPKELLEALDDKVKIMLQDDMWDHYINKFGTKILERNKDNFESYLYDYMLNRVSDSIGFNIPGLTLEIDNDPGNVEGYFQIVKELSDHGRVFRRSFGQAIRLIMTRAEENLKGKGFPYAYRLIIDGETEKTGIIFLAAVDPEMNRAQRCSFLHNLAMTAEYRFGLERVLGIATESLHGPHRSFDFMSMSEHKFLPEQDATFLSAVDQLWKSDPQVLDDYEFKP